MRKFILTLTALAGLLAGCRASAATPPPPPAPTTNRLVVCIDRSTSYEYTDQALVAFADLIGRLPREGMGWRVDLRWVAENSYGDAAQIMTVSIPPLPPKPQARPRNPFDRREAEARRAALEAYEAEVGRIRADAARAAEALSGLRWQPALGSDIWGCFSKAAELLKGGGWVAVASDLEPYGPQQRAEADLRGVRVHVVFFQARDARRAQVIRQMWVGWLKEAGAEEVIFHDPSRGLEDLEKELGVGDGRP
jgi:hypothetical protein